MVAQMRFPIVPLKLRGIVKREDLRERKESIYLRVKMD